MWIFTQEQYMLTRKSVNLAFLLSITHGFLHIWCQHKLCFPFSVINMSTQGQSH